MMTCLQVDDVVPSRGVVRRRVPRSYRPGVEVEDATAAARHGLGRKRVASARGVAWRPTALWGKSAELRPRWMTVGLEGVAVLARRSAVARWTGMRRPARAVGHGDRGLGAKATPPPRVQSRLRDIDETQSSSGERCELRSRWLGACWPRPWRLEPGRSGARA